MLSRTSEYALRAMVCLVRNADEWPVSGKRLAEETGVPRKYLSNILGDLVRAGLLTSSPGVGGGRGGGFAIVRAPESVSLRDILKPFEPLLLPDRPCPFGNEICSDENPCAGHEQWKQVRQVYEQFLGETSIHDVSVKQAEANGSTERKLR